MLYHIGTSGYAYKEWKGSFYPADIAADKMFDFYAGRFTTVEINNTFYKMPTPALVKSWVAHVPESFQFALKAPQTITHFKRLKGVSAVMAQFVRAAAVLKDRQGPLFIQLPPNFKKDLPRLEAFLKPLQKKSLRLAFEFRHESWLDEEVFDSLRRHGCALCAADTEEGPAARLVATTRWGYVRLRRGRYTLRQLAQWAEKIQAMPWDDVYLYFMHEDTGTGPRFADKFLELLRR